MHFTVLGAGVVGLATALELQTNFPDAQVTIVADKFGVETTSDVAAGIFRPSTSFTGPTEQITRKWMYDSYEYWNDLRKSPESAIAGVTQLSAYHFSNIDQTIVQNYFLEQILPIYRKCTADELELCPGEWKYGSFYTTVLTECRLWQKWALHKFQNANGKVQNRKIQTLLEFGPDTDVILNCTGFGARYLCNDTKMVPIRGQVCKVNAPWIKTAFYAEYDTYIIPGFDGVVTLGGTRQYESYDLNVSKHDANAIRERCEALLPSLQKAPVVREAVGLRPHRHMTRVEWEILRGTNEQTVKCVHNYGHGGYGVTTSPGTAKYAVQLVKELLGKSGSKL